MRETGEESGTKEISGMIQIDKWIQNKLCLDWKRMVEPGNQETDT